MLELRQKGTLSARLQKWRRRGRDVRILQEVSVSVSGSVYEERSPWPDSDEADAFCFMPVEERERDEADEKHCDLDVWPAAVAPAATLAISTSLLRRDTP